MAKVYNTRNFRANLKQVLDEVEKGTEVIISNGPRAFIVKCLRKELKSDE